MANRLFQTYVHHLKTGGSLDLEDTPEMKVVAIDTAGDNPDTSIGGDEFYDDISAGAGNTPEALGSPTVTAGVFDAADHSLADPGSALTIEELLIFYDTGTPGTSRLVLSIDTAGGLPLTQDGVADLITWSSSGIFAFQAP